MCRNDKCKFYGKVKIYFMTSSDLSQQFNKVHNTEHIYIL